MSEQRPTVLQAVAGDAGKPLAKLNALEGFGKALLIGVVPLLALEALGSKEAVTRVYLLASLLTLTVTLNFATLERLLQRRWVVTLGSGFTMLAAIILLFGQGLELALAIGLQRASASLFAVCLSLYIMDYIGKKELIYSESRRLFYTGIAWLVGPILGVWLWNETRHWAPFVLSMLSSALMLIYFWYLRLGRNPVIRKTAKPSVNPLKHFPRYLAQPALRIAYLISLSRALFWVTLFIYGPIYVVEAGLPTWIAGGLLSFTSALLLLSPLIRNLAGTHGVRIVIVAAQVICASAMVMLYLTGAPQPIGLLYWVIASLGAATVDVLGNIPFMRLVRPRERSEMTMIFSTWREASQLLTPLLVVLVLQVTTLEAYYLLLALILYAAGIAASFLPRRI